MDHSLLLEKVLECGATKAAIIRESDIVTNIAFFDICKSNSCGMYGRCYMCPPATGDPNALIEKVHSYTTGVLFQLIGEIEDSYDIEGMGEVGARHADISLKVKRELEKLLPADSWYLSAGGCHLCEECAIRTGEPCRRPDDAMIGMEGACIDVYNTTKNTELKYINGQNTVTYFGLVLFREEE